MLIYVIRLRDNMSVDVLGYMFKGSNLYMLMVKATNKLCIL
jgi:hypothetical protein